MKKLPFNQISARTLPGLALMGGITLCCSFGISGCNQPPEAKVVKDAKVDTPNPEPLEKRGLTPGPTKSSSTPENPAVEKTPGDMTPSPGGPKRADDAGRSMPQAPAMPDLPKQDAGITRVPPSQTEGWKKDETNALAVFKAVDAAIKNAANLSADVEYRVTAPEGNGGVFGKLSLKSSKEFAIDYFITNFKAEAPLARRSMAGNGTNMWLKSNTWVGPAPSASRTSYSGAELLKNWQSNFTYFAFNGLGSKDTPFTELVKAASDPKSGVKVTIERQKANTPGTPDYLRLLLVKPSGKLKAGFTSEIVVGSKSKLPLLMRVNEIASDKKERKYFWIAQWKEKVTEYPKDTFPF